MPEETPWFLLVGVLLMVMALARGPIARLPLTGARNCAPPARGGRPKRSIVCSTASVPRWRKIPAARTHGSPRT